MLKEEKSFLKDPEFAKHCAKILTSVIYGLEKLPEDIREKVEESIEKSVNSKCSDSWEYFTQNLNTCKAKDSTENEKKETEIDRFKIMTIDERMNEENGRINDLAVSFVTVENSFDWDPSNIDVVVLDNNMFRIEGKDSEKFLEKVLEKCGYTPELSINDLTDTLVQVFHVLTEKEYSISTHLYQAIPVVKNKTTNWELIFKFEHN